MIEAVLMAEATRRHMLKATVRLAALHCLAGKWWRVQSSLASQMRAHAGVDCLCCMWVLLRDAGGRVCSHTWALRSPHTGLPWEVFTFPLICTVYHWNSQTIATLVSCLYSGTLLKMRTVCCYLHVATNLTIGQKISGFLWSLQGLFWGIDTLVQPIRSPYLLQVGSNLELFTGSQGVMANWSRGCSPKERFVYVAIIPWQPVNH